MPNGKPNIVVFWGDDIGITNLSCQSDGLMAYRTPNLSFFRHIDSPAKVIVRLLKTGREAREVMPLMAGYDEQPASAVVARAELPVILLGVPLPPVVRRPRVGGTNEASLPDS